MAYLLKGLAGGSWALLIAWFLPAGLLVGVLALVVFPAVAGAPLLTPVRTWDTTTRSLAAGFLVVSLAITGNALSSVLYRVLEGYLLRSQGSFDAASERHRTRKTELKTRYDVIPERRRLARARAYERYRIYPDDDAEVGPTLLQNALRGFETFAGDRYGFDSQALWTELLFVAPKGVADEIDRARASVDFFIAMFWATLLLSVCAFGAVPLRWTATRDLDVPLLVFAALLPVLAYAWYRCAVASIPYWRSTVQALVNLGRLPLAAAVGLTVPATLEEERRMWQVYHDFITAPFDPRRAKELDTYRARVPQADAAGGPAPTETAASG